MRVLQLDQDDCEEVDLGPCLHVFAPARVLLLIGEGLATSQGLYLGFKRSDARDEVLLAGCCRHPALLFLGLSPVIQLLLPGFGCFAY